MVLKLLAILVLVAGCKQSLFDAHGGHDGGGGNGDGMIAATCPMPCLGDAGGDFGKGAPWRYLDDHRDRTWAAMTMSGSTYTGANPANTITSCASKSSAAACGALPGALLVSSAGATAPADPAIEYTAAANKVIQLQLGVRVPSGSPSQIVRLYRNSREDVLFTGTADPETTLSQLVTVDAIAGDRFLVALAPMAGGAKDVAVQLFVVGDGAAFPSTCQVDLPFSSAIGTGVQNPCGGLFTYMDDTNGPMAPALGTGPYAEAGMAGTLVANRYFQAPTALPRNGDFTVQMWMRLDMLYDTVTTSWAYSDYDLDNGGGIGIGIYDNGSGVLVLTAATVTSPSPTFDGVQTSYPMDKAWHLVRAVHRGDVLSLCLDGTFQGMKSLPGTFKSTYPPYLGQNVVWTPSGAFFIGAIDDVRVVTAAMPCN